MAWGLPLFILQFFIVPCYSQSTTYWLKFTKEWRDSGNLILVRYIVRNTGDITRAQAWVYLGHRLPCASCSSVLLSCCVPSHVFIPAGTAMVSVECTATCELLGGSKKGNTMDPVLQELMV